MPAKEYECAVRASLAAAAVDAKAAPRTWIGTKQPAPTRHSVQSAPDVRECGGNRRA